MKTKKCLCCGKELIKWQKKFCSYKCSGKSRKGKILEEILGKEKAKKKEESHKKTLKENPKIIIKSVKKRLQTLKENPEILLKKIEKYKKTLRDNPEISKQRTKKRRETYKKNPNIQKQQTRKKQQTYKENPKIREKAIKKLKQTYKNNPEIRINSSKKLKQTYKDNPSIIIVRVKKRQQTYKNNPKIQKNANKQGSATKQGIELKDWKKFVSREPYDQNWTPQFRRAIRKRDNQICMLCGVHREKLSRALDVHHINYDKKMSLFQNGVSLCIKCHLQTYSNRKHWIKFFQSLLSEKYGYQYDKGNIILNIDGVQK